LREALGRRDSCLAHLASVGIGVEAVIADHDLSFIRNMGGHTSDKLHIVHPLFLGLAFIILIANLAFCLIEREPLE